MFRRRIVEIIVSRFILSERKNTTHLEKVAGVPVEEANVVAYCGAGVVMKHIYSIANSIHKSFVVEGNLGQVAARYL